MPSFPDPSWWILGKRVLEIGSVSTTVSFSSNTRNGGRHECENISSSSHLFLGCSAIPSPTFPQNYNPCSVLCSDILQKNKIVFLCFMLIFFWNPFFKGHGFPQNQNQQDISTYKCANTYINICIYRKLIGGISLHNHRAWKKFHHCPSASWNQIKRWHGLAQEARQLKLRNDHEVTWTVRPKARESPELTRTNAGARRPSAFEIPKSEIQMQQAIKQTPWQKE